MTLVFPREPIAEVFLRNDWQDVSTDIRQSPPIVITQGRKDEASKPSPAKCTFTLDDGPENGNGDYNPNNPMGQWFGYLNRNTPIRLCLAYGADDFARVSASGWGTSGADEMGAWSVFTGAGVTASDISSGEGRHQVTDTNTFIAQYLDDVNIKNVDVYTEARFDTSITVTGNNLEIGNVMLRGQSTATYYMLRVAINTAQSILVSLMVGSSQTLVPAINVGTFWGTSDPMSIRFQADGNTFRGKVWRTSESEPVGWQLEYSHGDVFGAGWVGVRSGIALNNTNAKPINFLYDNFTVRIPRFAGEIVKMTPLSELNHSNQRTQVECAGAMRRYQLGQRLLETAIRRFLTADPPFAVTAYWPLDADNASDDRTKSLFPGGESALFSRTSVNGAVKWGVDTNRLSLSKAVEMSYGGILSLPLKSDDFLITLAAAFTWTQLRGADSEVAAYIFLDDGAIFFFEFHVGYTVDVSYFSPAGTQTILFGIFGEEGDEDQWSNLGFSWAASGGNTDYLLAFSDDSGTSTYGFSTAFNITGNPTSIAFVPFDSSSTNKIVVSNVAAFALTLFDGSPTLIDLIEDAMNGHTGEKAGERFVRLCTEENVSYGLIGYETISPPMGPQSRKTFWQLILETHDVSQGILFESRGNSSIVLRSNRSMQNQTPALTLDYANNEVSFPFTPIPDDQGLLNDVTAKRPSGSEFRVEQTTGPLNTADPGTNPNAVGRYDDGPTVNVETDTELGDAAGWRVHVGTATDPRFPTLTINLATPTIEGVDSKIIQVLDTGIGDAITVENMEDAFIFDDLRLIAQGYTETFDTAYQHTIVFNTTPASPWDSVTLDDATYSYIDSGSTTLNEDLDTVETDMTVVISDSADLWDDANQPFDIIVGGERMTVTAIAGATSPQTFTVVRSVNGVVKSHLASDESVVQLFRPLYVTM